MSEDAFAVRPAEELDRIQLAGLFASVAEERDGIAAEPPVDVEGRAASFVLANTFVAVAPDGSVVGGIWIIGPWKGSGEIAMMVARDWRGRGIGSALVACAVEWAYEYDLHKLNLSVFPHNAAGIALYRKHGFVEEGRRVKQIRRDSGELWDLIDMGLLLTPD